MELTKEQINEMVQAELDADQPNEFRVNVIPEESEKSRNWWYVTVKPTDPKVWTYQYNDLLHKIANKFEDEYGLRLLLVPALVD